MSTLTRDIGKDVLAPTRTHRVLDVLDERLGLKGLQYDVPQHANKLAYSLGGLSLVNFIVMVVTGVILTQHYDPDPTLAYASVRHIITQVELGSFVRGIHYWGAMTMIVLVGLHLLRVFVSGAYKRPREGNWLIGVVLAGITAAFFFTGTVLKWDQESLEALEHNIEIGKIIGRAGFWFSPTFGGTPLLTRLYMVHISVLPMLFMLVVATHLLLVKRLKMAPSPFRKEPEPEPTEPFSRHLVRLGGFALILVAVLATLGVLLAPGHGPSPVEGIEVTKPAWPLLWIYPIENWVGVAGILWATLAIFATLLIVPFVDRGSERALRKRLFILIPAAVLVVTIIGLIIYAAVLPVASHIGMG
jgi:ubiquinol-cytochrome c reductase cytochrome b subunit